MPIYKQLLDTWEFCICIHIASIYTFVMQRHISVYFKLNRCVHLVWQERSNATDEEISN